MVMQRTYIGWIVGDGQGTRKQERAALRSTSLGWTKTTARDMSRGFSADAGALVAQAPAYRKTSTTTIHLLRVKPPHLTLPCQ